MKTQILFQRLVIMFLLVAGISGAGHAQNTLKAVADTIDMYPYIPNHFNILANDSIPAGDTILRIQGGNTNWIGCWVDTSLNFDFRLNIWGCQPYDTGHYIIVTTRGDTASAYIYFRIHDQSYGYLDINNVRARFTASGLHFFWENAQFEVPKGSGKTSLFSNSFWIGGKDSHGQLHFAGERYRQGGGGGSAGQFPDFYAGPVQDSLAYSIYQDTVWNYLWNLKKSDIEYHRAHYWETGYVPKHDILTWPGNGDTALGQSHRLAPFSDRNGDGIYDPFDGDYPEIRGDQALFFIFNDDRGNHLESQGAKLRVEIHGMAYAFDMQEDTALNNTVFLHYKMVNRSVNTYDSTLLGVYSDIDLGYANDDFIGCDVERNIYFGYNGTPVDGTGQPYAYGENPPAQAVTMLAGPFMDPDGLDNPRYDINGAQLCDYSVNGLNFGDSVADNERFGLQRFIYFNNSNAGVPNFMTDPNIASEYYQMMCGKWKDSIRMFYGGNGHPSTGGYGPDCRFMFPGESDTLNWGVGCSPPNGPVNWTEQTAGNNPQDRRGLGVSGPFTFKPGDIQELDIAFIWARDYGPKSNMSSVQKLRLMADQTNAAFAANRLPDGNPFYGIGDRPASGAGTVKIYPNPASAYIYIELAGNSAAKGIIELVRGDGCIVKRMVAEDSQKAVYLDLSGTPSGIYFIRVTTAETETIRKVVVIR